MSIEYTTAGERVWNLKSKEDAQDSEDIKIKITEIKARNINPLKLDTTELASVVNSGSKKELV
jgi:hypothetical protein